MLAPAGEIGDMTVPWLFHEIRAARKSGTVFFEQDTLLKRVYFSNGDVLFASSNINNDRLGEFLLRQGKINREQFDSSSATVIRTKKKLGAVLCETGLLSPRDLIVQVKLQVKEIILSLFNWREGRYRFEEGNLSADEIVPLQMSAGDLILEAVQALDWTIIRKSLPATKTILHPSSDPWIIFQKASLSPDQISVLSMINGARTIEEICALSEIGDFNSLKCIYLLLALKMAEAGALKSEKGKGFARAAANEAAKAARQHASEPERPPSRQMIQEAFDAMEHQDDFQVLGVNNTLPSTELKKVYFRLAKRYHPDRHFEPEMADMKEKLESLFSRIHDAYERISTSRQNQDSQQTPERAGTDDDVAGEYTQKRGGDYVGNYAEKPVRAAAYFNAGMKDFTAGNFWGAAESFSWAARLDPVKGNYFYYLGMSLMHMPRRGHEAEENLQKAIQIEPRNTKYRVELGNLYAKSGLKNKAIDAYLEALMLNPQSEAIKQAITAAGGVVPNQEKS